MTRKKGASPYAVKNAYATQTIRNRSGGRRAAGVVAKIAKRNYRPDLRKVSISLRFPFVRSALSFGNGERYTRATAYELNRTSLKCTT